MEISYSNLQLKSEGFAPHNRLFIQVDAELRFKTASGDKIEKESIKIDKNFYTDCYKSDLMMYVVLQNLDCFPFTSFISSTEESYTINADKISKRECLGYSNETGKPQIFVLWDSTYEYIKQLYDHVINTLL